MQTTGFPQQQQPNTSTYDFSGVKVIKKKDNFFEKTVFFFKRLNPLQLHMVHNLEKESEQQ